MPEPAQGSTGRVAIVVVSHSAALAAAAVELATAMTSGRSPHVRIAAGTDGGLGTDATAVAAAITEADAAARGAGVVVLMDLGSAVMSAEMALDLVEDLQGEVVLSPAPFVEGLLGAVVQAAAGSSLERVLTEVDRAAGMKAAQLER